MKKLIISLAAALMTAGFVSAQDLATATESYNNGAAQLGEGNKVEALASFKEALTMAESLGEEGSELGIRKVSWDKDTRYRCVGIAKFRLMETGSRLSR